MNTKILSTLEFSKIQNQLSQHAMTEQGKLRAVQLLPNTEIEQVRISLQATKEASDAIRLKGRAPFGGIRDITASVSRALLGGVLSPLELVDIASTTKAARTLKRFILTLHETFPVELIYQLGIQLTEHKKIEEEVNRCIDETGGILDQASPELTRIRHERRVNESRVREKLEQMIRNSNLQKMFQEQIITIRNDRFVIPIKQEYRSEFGGFIHDQSASGATLFIEPESIVQVNNKIKELTLKESIEIEKILIHLSTHVAEDAQLLKGMIELLAELDFIFAKAMFAQSMKATWPEVNDQSWLRVRRARHPLIAEKEAVPLNLELGQTYTSIIVTGPNTGGKTVTLKTIGLLSLMAMAGLFIPAEDGSQIAVFDGIYADIGDEQSIEQSLSTFSSHMTNIIAILRNCTAKSLVLLDELGAGTDPAEGSALAIAILDHLHLLKCRVIATTHYPELKAYAYQRTGTMNASMEFDMQTLRPTYRLLVGVPGQSNAFAIASRLGLSESIIDRAREQVNEENMRVETMIASLQENRILSEQQRLQTEKQLSDAEKLRRELHQTQNEMESQKSKMIEKAKEDARRIIFEARNEADQILADLRRMATEEAATIKEHQLIEKRRKLHDLEQQWIETPKSKPKSTMKIKWQVGDYIEVISLKQKGHIVELLNVQEALVQLGVMKMKVNLDDVDKLENASSKQPVSTGASVKRTRDENLRLECDLRGMNLEDAILETDRFLDEAYLGNLGQVAIIHGKGTGVLRNGIQDFLRRHKHVKTFRIGTYHEGSHGVTIVELYR